MKAQTSFRAVEGQENPTSSKSNDRQYQPTSQNMFASTYPSIIDNDQILESGQFQDHYQDHFISIWADKILDIKSIGSKLIVLGTPIDFDFSLIENDCNLLNDKIKSCKGIFAFFLYNIGEQKISIFTDHLGIQPIYIKHNENGSVISTKASLIRSKIRISSLASLCILGFTIGDYTLGDGIERMKAGSIANIAVRKNHLCSTPYWKFSDCNGKKNNDTFDDLVDLFRSNTQQYVSLAPSGNLFLSGGYDSRLLLSFLLECRANISVSIISHSDEAFDLDGRLANAVARLSSLEHKTYVPSNNYYSSQDFEEYYRMTEGETFCLNLFICKLNSFINHGLIYDGLAPNHSLRFISGMESDFDAFRSKVVEPSITRFKSAANLVLKESVVNRMISEFREDLRVHATQFENSSTGMWQFLVSSRMRNRTSANAAKVFPNKTVVAPIGMDPRIWEVAGTLTLRDRITSRYVRLMLERLQPGLMAIPVISGGQLETEGAAGHRTFAARLAYKADQSWRLRALLQRVSSSTPCDAFSELDLERLIANGGDCLMRDAPPKLWHQDTRWRDAAKLVFHLEGWHWIRSDRLSERFRSIFSRNHCG